MKSPISIVLRLTSFLADVYHVDQLAGRPDWEASFCLKELGTGSFVIVGSIRRHVRGIVRMLGPDIADTLDLSTLVAEVHVAILRRSNRGKWKAVVP